MPSHAYLLLGSNIGDREAHLYFAIREINARAGKILKASSVYETEPWGVTNQANYLNAAVLLETDLDPESLIHRLRDLEREAGRTDQKKYAPRTLDIDILFYDHLVWKSEDLIIPHPKLHLRRFALVPLAELNSRFIHPLLHHSVEELLQSCTDPLRVVRL